MEFIRCRNDAEKSNVVEKVTKISLKNLCVQMKTRLCPADWLPLFIGLSDCNKKHQTSKIWQDCFTKIQPGKNGVNTLPKCMKYMYQTPFRYMIYQGSIFIETDNPRLPTKCQLPLKRLKMAQPAVLVWFGGFVANVSS